MITSQVSLNVHSLFVVFVKSCFIVQTIEVYLYFNILTAQMCLNEPQLKKYKLTVICLRISTLLFSMKCKHDIEINQIKVKLY